MSLDTIVNHINAETSAHRQALIAEAEQEAERLKAEARVQAAKRSQEIIRRAQGEAEKAKQKIIVAARLEGRKRELAVKQELVEKVLARLKEGLGAGRFKKQLITHTGSQEAAADIDFYLDTLRLECENEISAVLFGD